MASQLYRRLTERWTSQSYYQRFESTIALVLTLIVSLIIIIALIRLVLSVVSGLMLGVFDPLDHNAFQNVFGEIMTLLIALEFNHTLLYVGSRQRHMIQTSIVLLIALLAVARKFIVLDLQDASPALLAALAMATVALGATYALIRLRHDASDED